MYSGVLHRRKGELRRLTENEGVYKEVYASMDVMMAEDFGIDVGEGINVSRYIDNLIEHVSKFDMHMQGNVRYLSKIIEN